jgi:hypothetical protein
VFSCSLLRFYDGELSASHRYISMSGNWYRPKKSPNVSFQFRTNTENIPADKTKSDGYMRLSSIYERANRPVRTWNTSSISVHTRALTFSNFFSAQPSVHYRTLKRSKKEINVFLNTLQTVEILNCQENFYRHKLKYYIKKLEHLNNYLP